jgi:Transposase IS4
VLLSKMHDQTTVDMEDTKKPAAILDYNMTKGAVDLFDQQITAYSCARRTSRWPWRMFYFLVDTACMNAFVCFDLSNPKWLDFANSRRLDKRRHFLMQQAGESLVKPLQSNVNISRRPSVSSAMHCLGLASAVLKKETKKKRG